MTFYVEQLEKFVSEKDNNSSGQKDQQNNTKYVDGKDDMKAQMWFMKEKQNKLARRRSEIMGGVNNQDIQNLLDESGSGSAS